MQNLNIKYCTNKESSEKCAYRLTPEVESEARQFGKMFSLREMRCNTDEIYL